MIKNSVITSLAEFKSAMTVFAMGKLTDKSDLIAYDGKFLSIEIGFKAAVKLSPEQVKAKRFEKCRIELAGKGEKN